MGRTTIEGISLYLEEYKYWNARPDFSAELTPRLKQRFQNLSAIGIV
jgi:hypothetical protein